MMIDWSLALWAGVVGGVAMTMMMTLSRMMGMVDVEMALYQGCMITRKTMARARGPPDS